MIAPHPDDEVLGCGGTMARHLAAGDHVHVVVVTDGRRSRVAGLKPEAVAEVRRQEATNAASLLGVS
ncbi:MAG TPA: PIG-L family deacetylase, partial [Gammaproteobacteria bacterium]